MQRLAFLFAVPFLASAQDARLLSALPEGTFALVRCESPTSLRERARQNDWVRYADAAQEDIFHNIEHDLAPWTGTSLRAPLLVSLHLEGESLFFVAQKVSGLLTVPPAAPQSLLGAMRAWLEERNSGAEVRAVELLGGRVHMVPGHGPEAAASDLLPFASDGVRLSALLEHPKALGLFAADDEPTLLLALRNALLALEQNEEGSFVQAYRAARAAHTPLALECYIDFSPFAARAEAELAQAGQSLGIDPRGLLGLERGTNLYLTGDIYAGDRLSLEGALAIPPETLSAALADCFIPLPQALAAQTPKSAVGLLGLGWNYMAMIDKLRKALDEAGQETAGKALDGGLATAEAMTGVDLEEQFLRQLSGEFLCYFAPLAHGTTPMDQALGLQVGIRDAAAFEEAFEALLGVTLGEEQLELTQVEEQDVYVQDEFGFAILPQHALLSYGRESFAESIRALRGDVHASLATGTRLAAAVAENPQASFFLCLELEHARQFFLGRQLAAASSDAQEPEAVAHELPNPFDCQLAASARRTQAGFALRMYTR